jgi:hypothetical protein
LELDRRGAELLFHLLTEREEKASVGIASNESLAGNRAQIAAAQRGPPPALRPLGEGYAE